MVVNTLEYNCAIIFLSDMKATSTLLKCQYIMFAVPEACELFPELYERLTSEFCFIS